MGGPISPASRLVFRTGAILAGLAVALGAFGAHGLKSHTDAAGLQIWETAARYHFFHALALLMVALAWQRYSSRAFKAIVICFLAGIAIFSGSLYVLVLSGIKWLGAITPIGGTLLIIGWIILAVAHTRGQATEDN